MKVLIGQEVFEGENLQELLKKVASEANPMEKSVTGIICLDEDNDELFNFAVIEEELPYLLNALIDASGRKICVCLHIHC